MASPHPLLERLQQVAEQLLGVVHLQPEPAASLTHDQGCSHLGANTSGRRAFISVLSTCTSHSS